MIAAGDVYFRHIEFFPRAEESTTLEISLFHWFTYILLDLRVFMGLPWDIEEVLSMYDANRLQMGNGWHQRFFGNLNASMLHKSTLKKSLPCFFPIIGQGELRCPNDCSLEPSQKMRKDDRLLFIDTRFSAFFMLDNPLVLPITKRSMQLMLHWE